MKTFSLALTGVLEKRRSIKHLTITTLALLIGCALVLVAETMIPNSSTNLYLGIITLAIGVLVFGVVRMFSSQAKMVYQPTGSPVRDYVLYFQGTDGQTLESALRENATNTLRKNWSKDGAPIKMDVVVSEDQRFAACQVYQYVPHSYEPVGSVYVLPENHLSDFCKCVSELNAKYA